MALGSSPRKQKFTLDVGDARSPQKILVTVEADDTGSSNVNRRLFQSPTPQRATRRREKTTTITVPLKGLTDDESGTINRAATPKKRGRLPKAPTPATTRRKRAATPTQNTPRQPRRARNSKSDDTLTSEMSVEDNQATPKASARTRKPTKRKTPTPAKGDDEQEEVPKKRGRRRKSIAADEIEVLAPQEIPEDIEDEGEVSLIRTEESISVAGSLPPAPSDNGLEEEDNMSLAQTADNISVAGSVPPMHSGDSLGGDDIWMATLSDPPVAVGRQRSIRYDAGEPSIPNEPEQQGPEHQEPEQMGPDPAESEADEALSQASLDLWAPDAPSEAESIAQEPQGHGAKDTVLLGEEFTMISIGSLPSMQPNSSIVAADPQEIGEETSLIINRTLESMRQSLNERENDATEDAQEDIAASTTEPAAVERSLLDPGSNSMFAQRTSPQTWARSPRRAKSQPLGRQLALKSLQREDGIERPRNLNTEIEYSVKAPEDTSIYDDSFSEIPDDVLEAATPKAVRRVVLEDMNDTEDVVQPSVERPSMVTHSDPQSESKLLTPDETPSPVDTEGERVKGYQSTSKSLAQSEMRSSPPVFNFSRRGSSESVVRHSRHNSSETPAGNFISSRLPPRAEEADAQVHNLAPPETTPRPTLSPIVRAGRALQLVTSDPPSPPNRGSILGSPFRGSVTKSSQSPAPSFPAIQSAPSPIPVQQPSSAQHSNTTWSKAFAPFSQIKNLVSQGAQVFSPLRAPVPALEDPFGPGPANGTRPDYSIADVGLFNGAIGRTERAASTTSSTRADPPSDDEMSWQADDSPASPHGGHDQGTINSSVRGRIESVDASDMEIEIMDNFGEQGEEGRDESDRIEEDEDIWAIEAQRPTPRPLRSAVSQAPVLEPPRRSKLPSPWRQNSKRLVYKDELHKLPTGNKNDNVQEDEPEEFSMLSQPDSSEPPTEPRRNTAAPSRKMDLSNFFSSPALIPEVPPPGVNIFRFAETRRNAGTDSQPLAPQQPSSQKAATFASSTKSPVPQSQQVGLFASVPQKVLQIGNQPRVDLFSPVRRSPRRREDVAAHSSSPVTPERPLFSHVPQKRDFTPRLRQSGNALFGPVSNSRPSSSENEPVEFFVESDAKSEMDTSAADDSFIPPQLKPLPSRAVSPSKSCIRSPMKPKTPGRVVEFASSTLSPLAQAQARAERRASASPEKEMQLATTVDADKENQPDSEASSLSPSPSSGAVKQPAFFTAAAAVPTRLSQTTWTRQHWVRLDELLQQRRRSGALQFQLQHAAVAAAAAQKRKNGSGSGSVALLGKLVAAQGETMALEQWHLDVVDAFGAEVGGWEEAVLAKRLFALMVGEERRRRGEIPARRGVR